MKSRWLRFTLLLLAAAAPLLFSGCKSDDEIEARSEMPWNRSKSWETGLPSSLSEGR